MKVNLSDRGQAILRAVFVSALANVDDLNYEYRTGSFADASDRIQIGFYQGEPISEGELRSMAKLFGVDL